MNELQKKRQQIQELQAPKELRERLNTVLKKRKRKRKWTAITAVAAACLFVIIVMNYQVLAYYGQQFFGYDKLMSESLVKLNEEQMGQGINQSMQLADGTKLTIDGVISEANQFHVYHRLENGQGVNEDIYLSDITGFMTNSNRNYGTWEVNEAGTEVFGIQTFEAVSPFAKKLTVVIDSVVQREEMTFPYDAAKAVPTMLKTKVRETFTYDYGKLKFKELVATKGSTVIKGKLTKTDGRRFAYDFGGIQLVADGKVLDWMNSGYRSTLFGKSFEMMYEAIPEETKQLEIRVATFNGYEQVKMELELNGETMVAGNVIQVLDVTKHEDQTYVTIVSDEGVYLDDVALVTAQGNVPLEKIQLDEGAIGYRRTLLFKTNEEALRLFVGGVYYQKAYNKKIEIDL